MPFSVPSLIFTHVCEVLSEIKLYHPSENLCHPGHKSTTVYKVTQLQSVMLTN